MQHQKQHKLFLKLSLASDDKPLPNPSKAITNDKMNGITGLEGLDAYVSDSSSLSLHDGVQIPATPDANANISERADVYGDVNFINKNAKRIEIRYFDEEEQVPKNANILVS